MNILHVITGLPKASGVTTFVENVVREQRALGHTVEVLTNANVHQLTTNPQPLTPNPSLIHIHGLWSPLLHKAARFARKNKIPVVWSTHGMSAPWSLHHKWWKKMLPWYLYQKPDLRSAALIHCTTDLEAEWNKALGFKNVFVAPLGTTLPKASCAEGTGRARSPSAPHVLLYVGRIYPVKALDNAIRAVALMKRPITLRIVGPDQSGHMSELMSLCDSLHLPYTKPGEDNSALQLQLDTPTKQVQFIGPKYDADLSAEYDACDALILVSHTENFGATVVDALAHAKPVITSTNTPWSIVQGKSTNSTLQRQSSVASAKGDQLDTPTKQVPNPQPLTPNPSASGRCGWWVNNSPESLARTFDAFASTSTSNLHLLGQNGRALVQAKYTWESVAKTMENAYEEMR